MLTVESSLKARDVRAGLERRTSTTAKAVVLSAASVSER
jgi:hypothetical protein